MELSQIHAAIAALAKFRGAKESKERYLYSLMKAIDTTTKSVCSDTLDDKIKGTDKITMQFVYASLHLLQKLSEFCKNDAIGNLMSIQQQQKIKILLQIIFSIGILPSLVRGVDIALANKTVQLDLFDLEDWTLVESYNMMREIVRTLLEILKSPNLRSLILVHLGDLMAALLQLIHIGDIKKPVKVPGQPLLEESEGRFVMTEKWHDKLVQDRIEFRAAYDELVGDIYKPLVIRELLVLLAPVKFADGGKDLNPPLWLRRAVSQQLSGYLTSPGGVSLVMRAMCDSSSDTVDWKRVDAIAKLISTVHGNLDPDDFFSIISPQIISLLNTTGVYCIPVAVKCIKKIYYQYPEVCNKYIFDKMFEPFVLCSKPVTENFNGTLISEDSLSRCIDHINKCFNPGSRESSLPFLVLIKIIKIKFRLFSKVTGSLYSHQLAVQDLLVRFLHSESDLWNLMALYNALIFNEPHPEILEMNDNLEFEFGPTGGVQVVTRKPKAQSQETEIELSCEKSGDYVLDLLSSNDEYSRKLLYGLFAVLLSSMMSVCYDEELVMPKGNTDLLTPDDLIVYIVGKSQKKIVTIKLLAVLAENTCVIEEIQDSPDLVLGFLDVLLEKKAEVLLMEKDGTLDKEEEAEDAEVLEDVIVTLGILDIVTMNLKAGCDKWEAFRPMLNSVKTIKDHSTDNFVVFLAALLYERITTYGAVSGGGKKTQFKGLKKEKEKKPTKVKNKNKKPLIQDLPDEEKKKTEFEQAVDEIGSSDIPTKGHGLIEMSKLIKKSDPEMVSSKDLVLTMLKQNLQHEDSYIYLAAINALEAMALIHAGMVVELLAEEYSDNAKNAPEVQMKIGEAMVRVTRTLGDLVPKYKALLVNTFMRGVKHQDEYVRASSLSNLGEVLNILGFCVGSIIQEVYTCVQGIASFDKSPVARRAAVLVAQLLLKGVSDSTFVMMEPVIRNLYRCLIHIYKTDKDDVTRLHAEMALSEVDWLVRACFMQTKKLEKHIRFLDVPH